MAKKSSSCGSCQGSCHGRSGKNQNEAVQALEFLGGLGTAVVTGVPGYKEMARTIMRDFEKANGRLGPAFREFWELLEELGEADLQVNIKELEKMGIDTGSVLKAIAGPSARRTISPAKPAKPAKARRPKA